MKVFISGATGILGRRTVPLLVAGGHDVTAVARSDKKAALVTGLGATAVAVDVFDPAAVETAVAGHDAVINLATHIPSPMRIARVRAWRENDRLRAEASRNLVDAAIRTEAGRYIQESIGFFYLDMGDAWADEDTPLDLPAHARSSASAEAEAARFTDAAGTGVALRFAMFYAEDSHQSRLQVKLARLGISPFFGARDEYQSIIHVGDAASAVFAAVAAPSGVYNITDNEPLTKAEAAAVLAAAVARKRLRAIPRPLLIAAGTVMRSLCRSERVSNARFRRATGWEPSYPSAREGFQALVGAVSRAS